MQKAVFYAFSSYDCRCGTSFETRNMESSSPPDREEFVVVDVDWEINPDDSMGITYTCPECGMFWVGRADRFDDNLETHLKDENGLQQSGTVREPQVLLEHSEGQRIIELLSELDTSAAILQSHFKRLDSHVQTHIFEIEQDERLNITADIKAYLAEAYSLKSTFRALCRLDLPEQRRAEKLFDEYENRSRVVDGLRIYTQKERNLHLKFRAVQGNRITPMVEVETVEVMESQTSRSQPDGYKHGHENYYGHLTEEEINLHELLEEHANTARWFVQELAKAISGPDSEARSALEDWISLQEQYLESLGIPVWED